MQSGHAVRRSLTQHPPIAQRETQVQPERGRQKTHDQPYRSAALGTQANLAWRPAGWGRSLSSIGLSLGGSSKVGRVCVGGKTRTNNKWLEKVMRRQGLGLSSGEMTRIHLT